MASEKLVLISVPHTGTNFTLSLFRGWQAIGLNQRAEGRCIHHGHMIDIAQIQMAEALAREYPLILPLRHPFRVEESYRRRRKDISQMIYGFRAFQRFLRFDPLIFAVDSPWRERGLAEMAEKLGIPLETDWALVRGIKGTHDIPLSCLSPSEEVLDIADEMQAVLRCFYGDIHEI